MIPQDYEGFKRKTGDFRKDNKNKLIKTAQHQPLHILENAILKHSKRQKNKIKKDIKLKIRELLKLREIHQTSRYG